MKLKLAGYRDMLLDTKSLQSNANLESTLFTRNVVSLKEEEIENWKPDFTSIFHLLSLNYENPRAMNCFIFYDIQDNKIRVKLAKYLLERGCQRIQKSVYLANISKRIYTEILATFKELESVFNEEDSIFMVPIGEYHLAEMHMIGKDVNMSFARSNEYVLFI